MSVWGMSYRFFQLFLQVLPALLYRFFQLFLQVLPALLTGSSSSSHPYEWPE
jgi:hypothetical protein